MGFQGSGWVPDERDGSHDVSMASDELSHSSVDFRPVPCLAWAGCRSKRATGVDRLGAGLVFWLGVGLFHLRWNCSYSLMRCCNIKGVVKLEFRRILKRF